MLPGCHLEMDPSFGNGPVIYLGVGLALMEINKEYSHSYASGDKLETCPELEVHLQNYGYFSVLVSCLGPKYTLNLVDLNGLPVDLHVCMILTCK